MKLEILTKDPLRVLSSTRFVVENARDVFLNEKGLGVLAERVAERLGKGLESAESAFGATGNYERDVQLIFLEDAVNFCFWPEKDKPKWEVEWPSGQIIGGGWYCLKTCFERALAENIPILTSSYLERITFEQTQYLFRGRNNVVVPLLEKRQENLREAGRVLKQKYAGLFTNVLESARQDAVSLVKLIYENFPSFRDVSLFQGKELYFLKRPQLCVNDISYLPRVKLEGLEELTVFADYKLPQIFREFGVLNYSPELAEKVDNMVLIPEQSPQEIEIRAATIWAGELIRQKLNYGAGQIDNALWLLSQELPLSRPHHRTYTSFY